MSPPPAKNAVGITSGLSSEDRFDQSRKCEGIERPFGARRRRPVRLRSSPNRCKAWSSSPLPHYECEETLLEGKGPRVNGEAYHRPISVPAVSRAQQLSRAIVYFLLIGRQNFFEAIPLLPALSLATLFLAKRIQRHDLAALGRFAADVAGQQGGRRCRLLGFRRHRGAGLSISRPVLVIGGLELEPELDRGIGEARSRPRAARSAAHAGRRS